MGWRKKAGIICKIFIFYWGTSNNESEGRDSSGSTDSSDSIYFSTVILDKWMGSLIKLNMVAPLITDPPHSNPTSCKIKLFDKDSWGRASVTWKLLVEQHQQHFFRHFSFVFFSANYIFYIMFKVCNVFKLIHFVILATCLHTGRLAKCHKHRKQRLCKIFRAWEIFSNEHTV